MKKLLFLLILLLSGCYGQEEYFERQKQRDLEQAREILPSNSKNIRSLGNRWFTFELEGRQYLFTFWYGGHGEYNRSITEISK